MASLDHLDAVHGVNAPAPTSYEEFWPYYVSQHLHPATRRFHAWGTVAGFVIALAALATGQFAAVALAPVAGYGASWYSHFFIERNKPASFGHPAWSFRGDMRLVARYFRGTLAHDVAAVRADIGLAADELTLAARQPMTASA